MFGGPNPRKKPPEADFSLNSLAENIQEVEHKLQKFRTSRQQPIIDPPLASKLGQYSLELLTLFNQEKFIPKENPIRYREQPVDRDSNLVENPSDEAISRSAKSSPDYTYHDPRDSFTGKIGEIWTQLCIATKLLGCKPGHDWPRLKADSPEAKNSIGKTLARSLSSISARMFIERKSSPLHIGNLSSESKYPESGKILHSLLSFLDQLIQVENSIVKVAEISGWIIDRTTLKKHNDATPVQQAYQQLKALQEATQLEIQSLIYHLPQGVVRDFICEKLLDGQSYPSIAGWYQKQADQRKDGIDIECFTRRFFNKFGFKMEA